MDGEAELADAALRALLGGWAAEAATSAAAEGRRRERWLRQREGAAATLAGALVDLGEAGAVVRVSTPSWAWGGVPVGVGPEVVVLQPTAAGAAPVVVRLAAVVAVALVGGGPGGGAGGAGRGGGGDRPGPLGTSFEGVLELLGADRSPARLHLEGGATADGVVWSVGTDVVDVVVGGPGRPHVLLATRAVEAASPR